MAIRWTLHEGKRILECDYRGLSPDLSLLQLEESTCLLGRCHGKVLLLSVFGGDEVDHQFIQRVHQLGRALARGAASKVALVGIDSLKFVMREAYAPLAGMDPLFFSSEDHAIEWLVSEAGIS